MSNNPLREHPFCQIRNFHLLIYMSQSSLYTEKEIRDMFLVRIDSSMVAETSNKLKQGFTVGRKTEGKEDRKQIRYTMAYDGFAAKLVEVLSEIAFFTYEKGHGYKLRVRKTIFANVISPLSDKIRLVVASGDGPMLKYIVPKEDFRHITSTMKEKEQLTYVLVLANVYKKGLQRIEITFVRMK